MTQTLTENTQDSSYQTKIRGIHVAQEIKDRTNGRVFEVYWVHLPEHTDIRSQGYVGITCQGTATRFVKHRSDALNRDKKWVFHRAIRKYGYKNLIVETILVCDYEYALQMENNLRPNTYIGWNVCEGGGTGFLEGLEKLHGTPEFSKMRSDHMYSAWQDEGYVEKVMNSRKKYFDETPPWRREGNAVNHTAWGLAGTYYVLHNELGWNAAKISNYIMYSNGSICRVWEYISKNDWNPTQDEDYMDLYPIPTLQEIVEVYGDPEQYHMSWSRKDAAVVWKVADELYELFHSDVPLADMARHADATWHQTHKIHRKFQNGWNPYEDLRWLVEFKGYKHEH